MSDTHLEVAGRSIRLSSPDKVLFPAHGWTKLDVAEHYLMCAEGAVRGVFHRPTSLKRWPGGVTEDFFFTKRAPGTVTHTHAVAFPSARPGNMPYVDDAADIVEQVQLGVVDLNPWNARIEDLDHPDELRIDLDPTPGFTFDHCREIAGEIHMLITEKGLTGWPKTSGSRGIHIYVRIEPRWDYFEVRRAGLALARELERRTDLATTAWWKEERSGVFIDYNQNARDKTIASAYSIRQTGLVSTPFRWDELDTIDPAAMTLVGFRERWSDVGDLTTGIDDHPGDLGSLLEMVAEDEANGVGDAPWPPHYPKMPGEPPRVQPSKRKME
ncbi:MAG TPA: DNA primase small subunit domain-containing protein [Acidimicrobiia bacterium]|nr:DNA primase small subunit domain-containing protein [Acidimicrobiia bacterium]